MINLGVKCPCCGKSYILDNDSHITTDYANWCNDWEGDERFGAMFYCKDCDQKFGIIFKIEHRQFWNKDTKELKDY